MLPMDGRLIAPFRQGSALGMHGQGDGLAVIRSWNASKPSRRADATSSSCGAEAGETGHASPDLRTTIIGTGICPCSNCRGCVE